ncbi:hypothetical protein P9A63_12195 [Staphylococcus aureus]
MLCIHTMALNVISNKLKMKDSNIISFIYRGHDTVIYNHIDMTKATSNIGRGF